MDWLSENAWAAWLAVAGLLAAGEALGLDLVLLMLAVGAVGGGVAALVGAPLAAQLVVAAVVSGLMLFLVRPSVKKRLHRGDVELRLGPGKLVGSRAVVTAPISASLPGRVRLDGEVWSAAPYDDDVTMVVGETVEVFEIRGATAFVHPVDRPV